MKPIALYSTLLAVVYALLFWLGNNDHDTESRWNQEAAPWLGEAPAGVESELVRAQSIEELPFIEYSIPADAALKQNIITTFQLAESSPGVYTNNGIRVVYPDGNEVIEKLYSTIYPGLTVNQDGSMRLCVNNLNKHEQSPAENLRAIQIPNPQYLPDGDTEMQSSLMLAVLCFLLPGAFCSIGWLWIQRKPIRSRDTVNICLWIPGVVAFIGACVDFYVHGFNVDYTVYSATFSVISNLICSGLIIGATAAFRGVWNKIVA